MRNRIPVFSRWQYVAVQGKSVRSFFRFAHMSLRCFFPHALLWAGTPVRLKKPDIRSFPDEHISRVHNKFLCRSYSSTHKYHTLSECRAAAGQYQRFTYPTGFCLPRRAVRSGTAMLVPQTARSDRLFQRQGPAVPWMKAPISRVYADIPSDCFKDLLPGVSARGCS